MVRISRVVPKEWTKYSPIGGIVDRTRFIVFKTPLNDELSKKVPREARFTTSQLFRTLAERGQTLGLVVDLTDTDRYYDKNDFEGMCVKYTKINCPGRGFVDRDDCVSAFNDAIQSYTEECDDETALIGVHCTHGVNRSGYLICRFLIERLGWSSHEALNAFEKARGYPIEKGSYVRALHIAAKEYRTKRKHSDGSDSESSYRKSKKSKKSRKSDVDAFGGNAKQMGDMIEKFFGQLGQLAPQPTSDSPSGYSGSPMVNGSYASPQQKWPHVANTSSEPAPATPEDEAAYDEAEEEEDGALEGGDVVKSAAAKRRERKARQQKMLAVMKRGRFHEIQEAQAEYYSRQGANLRP